MNEQNQTAKTIYAQLGGNRFKVMTGAKEFQASPTALVFKIARRSVRINHDASDTYTVITRTLGGKTLKSDSGVYADQLQSVFTAQTGLHTSL